MTSSDRIGSTSTAGKLSELQEKNRVYAENRLSRIDVEAQFAAEQVKREQSADTWYDRVQEMLDDVGDDFKQSFGDNPTTVAEAKSFLDSLVHSLFDPESVLASTSTSSDIQSADRLVASPSFPSGIAERTQDLWTYKDAYGAHRCQRSLIAATVSAAGRVVSGAVSNASRALRAAQVSLGLASSSAFGVGDALAAVAARTLLDVLGGQDIVVAQLRGVARQIADLADGMTSKDYLFDHANFIREQRDLLLNADAILAQIEASLLFAPQFDAAGWEAARKIIKQVSENLRKLGLSDLLSGFSAKPMRLYLLALYADTLLSVLRRYQAISDRIAAALLGFAQNFANVRFDNLFAPVVDLLRCRIRKVIEDMDATIAKNSLLYYIVKEKQWSLELAAVAAFMKMTAKVDLPGKLDRFSGTEALRDAFSALTKALTPDPNERDLRYLISVGSAMVLLAKQKAASNIPSSLVVSAAEATIVECDRYTQRSGHVKPLLGGYVGLVVVAAPTAVAAVAKILRFAEEHQCSSFTDAVSEGRIDEAFQADALTSSLEGHASSLIAHVIADFEATGGKRGAESDLLVVNQTFQNDARSLGLLDELKNGYASRHIEDRVIGEGAVLRENDVRIRRAAVAAGTTLPPKDPQFIPVKKAKAAYLAESGG